MIGATLGTVGYLSPEQLKGERRQLTFKSDLHAIGTVLYFALTGRHPFTHDNPPWPEYRRRVLAADYVPVLTIRPTASPQLAEVVKTMLSARPYERYKTPELARGALT